MQPHQTSVSRAPGSVLSAFRLLRKLLRGRRHLSQPARFISATHGRSAVACSSTGTPRSTDSNQAEGVRPAAASPQLLNGGHASEREAGPVEDRVRWTLQRQRGGNPGDVGAPPSFLSCVLINDLKRCPLGSPAALLPQPGRPQEGLRSLAMRCSAWSSFGRAGFGTGIRRGGGSSANCRAWASRHWSARHELNCEHLLSQRAFSLSRTQRRTGFSKGPAHLPFNTSGSHTEEQPWLSRLLSAPGAFPGAAAASSSSAASPKANARAGNKRNPKTMQNPHRSSPRSSSQKVVRLGFTSTAHDARLRSLRNLAA